MGFDPIRRLLLLMFWLATAVSTYGQEAVLPARAILDVGESEQIAFINRTMDLGFPENRADQMTMLIINRSTITLPLIEARLEQSLKSIPVPQSFVETASEMIAYAGDESALREISKLMALDENRFGRLVGRTLDNAGSWRNAFNVAYRGLEIGDAAISGRIAEWSLSALKSNRMQRAWAEALLNRYGKVPGDSEWATDPIVSRLNDRASSEVRQSVLRFVTESQSKRERR